jgi:hypothetical protein
MAVDHASRTAPAKGILVSNLFCGVAAHVPAAAFQVIFRRLDIFAENAAILFLRVYVAFAGDMLAQMRFIHCHGPDLRGCRWGFRRLPTGKVAH